MATTYDATVTCHKALYNTGFGGTTRVINGIECGAQPGSDAYAKQQSRIANFQRFAAILGYEGPQTTQNLFC